MDEARTSGLFDRFAGWASGVAARAPFFAFCVALVIVWALSIVLIRDINTWQLIINTITTIVTFLLVALLQNSQDRATRAMQHKLDALSEAVAQVLDETDDVDESGEMAGRLREIAGVSMEPSR